MKYKNKRGNVIDVLFIPIILIVISVVLVISVRTTNSVKDALVSSDLNSNSVTNTSLSNVGSVNNMWDTLWIFIIFGVMIGVWVSAYFVRTYPVFFWIALLVFIILLFLVPTVANVYSNITNTSEYSSTATLSFPKTSWVVSYYPLIILVFIIVTAVLLYSGINSEVGL